jgi:hypothetical protein
VLLMAPALVILHVIVVLPAMSFFTGHVIVFIIIVTKVPVSLITATSGPLRSLTTVVSSFSLGFPIPLASSPVAFGILSTALRKRDRDHKGQQEYSSR